MLSSHELLGFMSPDLAMDIVTFSQDTDKALYRTTLAAVAEARKVRPIFLERQPKVQRHATMLATLTRPALEMVTASLIRAWLLKKHVTLLCDFLDALGIQHKEGVVDELPDKMDVEKLKSAVDTLLGKYPQEVVAVYLNAFTDMNEVDWPSLKEMLAADARLQLRG
jgi:hypothetical protein